jgi:RNA polymerase sigma-70 factor, ECF subfamily
MNANDQTDELSLTALRTGDRAEFARMLEKYSDPIYRLALRMTGDAQDAEDVLQETFIKAMRALPDFEGRSSLSTWLYRIGMNEALMLLRRRKNNLPLEPTDEADGSEGIEPRWLEDWCCQPETELMNGETRKFLDTAIEHLTPGLRAVFLLRDVQGLSVRDTAEALSITESAVKVRLLRARLRLREILSGYFIERKKEMMNHDLGS